MPVTAAAATLGCTIDVLTLDGMVELKVPPGSQPEARLLMRGKGIQRVNAYGRGNQYVHLKVTVPRALSEKQRELLEQLVAEEEALRAGGGAGGEGSGSGAGPGGGAGAKDAHGSFADLCSRTLSRLKTYLQK